MENNTRVVITGLGAVSPLGISVSTLWDGLLHGKSGVRKITAFDASDFPCQIAGEIPDFEPNQYLDRKLARRIPRSSQIALVAAMEAIADAGLPEQMSQPERAGVVFGTAIGGLDRLDEGIQTLRNEGLTRVNPFVLPTGIPNLAAFLIAEQFQCLGANTTVATACATGTQVLGEATEFIRRGVVDLVVAGGTEAVIQDFSIAGFLAMRALPLNYNDNPEKASRPFDAKREGFVFSEGSGVLVLESERHALARGARIHAEVIGHASSADGYHMAAPDPEGKGPARAMKWALEDGNVKPNEVDYINAHGSSTPLNGVTETKAIKAVFGEDAREIPISSTKSMLGHAMGASGALEAIILTLSIKNSVIPPTINYEYPDPECDLDYVPNHPRRANINVALSNSFGLGGQNACLIVRKY
jgi:3-oxoacyl-[acyl-carrier-protein] synthase II